MTIRAALGTLRKLGLDRLLSQGGRQPELEVALCVAMIVARLIEPASKLATARVLDEETATCSLGQVLGLGAVDEQQLYGSSTGSSNNRSTSRRRWPGAT